MKLKTLLLLCICISSRAEIPNCDYFDTVDLTYSEKLANGSYIHEGAVIPIEQIGTYNYKIFFEGTKITVKEHLRGCVCKIKPCIRYCCHRHRLDLDDESKCTNEFKDDKVNLTLENGTQRESSIRNQFVVQPGINIDCNWDYVGPFSDNNGWKLFENGTRSNNMMYLSKRDYCIQPKYLAIQGNNYMLLYMNCLNNFVFNYVKWTYILLVLLTILIYVFVIRLQHVYDKCCLCYLICYLISELIMELISAENFLLGTACYIVAYFNYFVTISTYLWLVIMSFDFFRIFVSDMFVTHKYNNQLRFLKYSLFVWGMATVFLLITILADKLLDTLDINTNWKVGYAYYECIMKFNDRSIVIYLTVPIAVMIIIKAALMIASVWHVRIENRKNRKQLVELRQHNIKSNMMSTFYLRLLLTEIVNWIAELTSLLFYTPFDTSFIKPFVPYFNLIYCILILAITVTRKDVRHILYRR